MSVTPGEAPQTDGAYRVLAVQGCLDASTGTAVLYRLLRSMGMGTVLTVDLSGVDVLDAAGAGALLAARDRARNLGGDLRLCGVPACACLALSEAASPGDLLAVLPSPSLPAADGQDVPQRVQTRENVVEEESRQPRVEGAAAGDGQERAVWSAVIRR